ncbi:asparagine synthetase B, partial [bacterium]|nr:asparagine synthetase B [bacterium]
MVEKLGHRGPDEHGMHTFSNCVLGHTRLSVVDLSTGAQPMLSEDMKKGITFNGEIYGYRAIRENLRNYLFRTTSDTEVILALYEKYGEKCTRMLPGMFSFALWDDDGCSLFCGRDRFGEKPFFYARGIHDEFIFASEIKAILSTGLVTPVLDYTSLSHYLRYLYVPPDRT